MNNQKTYVYQLTDHLGNVRAVFMKEGNDASLEGYTDYYPFGMPMPGRSLLGAEGYRYAFQGQEKDSETGKEAFELRLWDSRIGRWLTTDPMGEFASPYLGMGNNPINRVDPTGGKTDCPDCADTIYLNEVVVTASGEPTNFSDRFPTLGIVGAEHLKDPSQYITWDSSFDGDINDYNRVNNTNYGSEREAMADYNYTFNYLLPQLEQVMAMHQATGEMAEFISYILPTPTLGVSLAMKGAPVLGRAFKFSSKYVDDIAIKVSVYGDDLIHSGKRIGIDKIYNGYKTLPPNFRRTLYPIQKSLIKERTTFRNIVTTKNLETLIKLKKYRGGI